MRITIESETLERALDALDACTTEEGPGQHELDCSREILATLRAALAAQPDDAPSMQPLPNHDNHHNALKCPYCNPRGLVFAEPAPAAAHKGD